MNFDELKKQWDNQSSEEVQINPDIEIKKEANTTIDKVRKVMKKDFFFQLTSFPLLLLYPFYFEIHSTIIWWMIACIFAIMTVPLYYLIKFYKSSYRLEYNSLRNINWFYYNFKSSVNIFTLYTYTVCILCILFMGSIFIEREMFLNVEDPIVLFTIIIISLILYIIFCIWVMKWWIKKLYKKPLEDLKEILNQLEE
ncbi:hypothetical protein [Faecalibacter bovis]|uniref:Uncharacterized protein n=1 Tax=Faecalibacter bovis TaxID=2898187 RepID=A0ABX7XGB6_9FLAO|nr:hypothetical protein [Faecalibacter bovis]QTV06966.1 hypothetical protein J9309_06600 [Faecalibacter bovis]